MSLTFGPGITLGKGITVGPYTVPAVDLRWDPAYKGIYLDTELNNTSVYDVDGGQYVCLTDHQMSATGRYMASFTMTYNTDIANGVGVANRSVNLDHYLGWDANGIGIYQNGEVYYNGGRIATGYPSYVQGDVIDLAINNSTGYMWYRVSGGYWNGDSAANPATGVGGIATAITGEYFAGCVGGFMGPSEWALCMQSLFGTPEGYTYWAPGVGLDTTFTINVGDFANGSPIYQNTNPLGTNGTEGFENTTQETWLGEGYFMTNLTGDTITKINAAMVAAGINPGNSTGHVFLVTWGAGSSIAYGLVKFGYSNGNYIDIQAIDYFVNTDWQTPDSTNGYSLVGTFRFPATFVLYTPLLAKGGWC